MPEQKTNLIFPEDLKEKIRKVLNTREDINLIKESITKSAADITNIMTGGRDPEGCINQLEGAGNELLKSIQAFKTKALIQDKRNSQELLNDMAIANNALNKFFKNKYLYESYSAGLVKDHSGFYTHTHGAKISFDLGGSPIFKIFGTLVFSYEEFDSHTPDFIFRTSHISTYSAKEVSSNIKEITKEEYEKAVMDISKKAIKQVI